MERIEIQLSKKNILLYIVVCIAFVVSGFLFVANPTDFVTNLFRSPATILVLGFPIIGLFGLMAFLLMKKLSDTKVGLVVDDQGINDNSSATSVGMVEWEDVSSIKSIDLGIVKSIVIDITKPEKYIDRGSSKLTRYTLQKNYETYGSPVIIAAAALKIKHESLIQLLQDEYKKREAKAGARDTIKPESEKN